MSIGNLKDNGNKGNNFSYQLAVLNLLDQINNSISALPGVDYETRTTTYQATAAGPGYSIGDILVRYDIINVNTGSIATTVWFNQTTQSVITAPAPGNITPVEAPSSVTVINTPSNPVHVNQVGISRLPAVVNALANGSTTAGAKSVSLWFRGNNGTLNGVPMPNNAIMSFTADQGSTIGAIPFTVPNTGEVRIIITYLV